jgi:hypothetical protein
MRRVVKGIAVVAGLGLAHDWLDHGGMARLCARLGLCETGPPPPERERRPKPGRRGGPRTDVARRGADARPLPDVRGDSALVASIAVEIPSVDQTADAGPELPERAPAPDERARRTVADAEHDVAPAAPARAARPRLERGTTLAVRLEKRACTAALGPGERLRGSVYGTSLAGAPVEGLDGAPVLLRVVDARSTRNPAARATITLALEGAEVRGERVRLTAATATPPLEPDREDRAGRAGTWGAVGALLGAAADYADKRDVKSAARTGAATGAAGAVAGAATARRTGCLPQGAPIEFELTDDVLLPAAP